MNFQPVIPNKTPSYPLDALTGRKLYCMIGYPLIYIDTDNKENEAYYSYDSMIKLSKGENPNAMDN